MKKHLYRTLLIWGVLIVSLVFMYPTVGWMMLSDDDEWIALPLEEREKTPPKAGTRQDRMLNWQKEDDEFARERRSTWETAWHAIKRWSEFDRNQVINLGLDLQGGVHMVLRFDYKELPAERLKDYQDRGYSEENIEKEIQETVLQQIRRRVEEFEAKEPVIQALGSNQIQIQLPGEKDTARARALITKTALLNFHIVSGNDETVPVFQKIKERFPDEFMPYIKRPMLQGEPFTFAVEHYDRVKRVLDKVKTAGGIVPEDKMIAFSQKPKPYEKQEYNLYMITKDPIATGTGLRSAVAIPDQNNPPYWEILFTMSNAAGAAFGDATEKNINRPMAIVIDGVIISAPVIRDRITTRGSITGRFEGEEARDLSIALNSGSMVVPVHEEFTRVVGASLGSDATNRGVISAVVTLVVVGGFMVVYYMWSGVVAMLGLVYCFIMIIGLMAYFQITLTLPGIAGLILTIGMAVDANILIYERFREELRMGHALASCVSAGFKRASTTILDANITTLIAAVVLMQFGTGPVQGFAITLAIGVVATIFFSLVVCHAIFDFLLEHGIVKNRLKMLHLVPANPGIPFLEIRRIAFVFSIIAILTGITFFLVRGSDVYGVDFTQGTNINLTLKNDVSVPVNDIRLALANEGFQNPIVQKSGEVAGTNDFLIRVSDLNPEETKPAAPAEGEAAPAEGEAAPAAATSAEGEATPAATPAEAASDAAKPGSSEQEASAQPAADAPAQAQTTVVTVAERMQKALASLTTSGQAADVVIEDQQTVGPAVGAQLRRDAVWAILMSFFFMIIYLTFRYDIKFAVMGVVALFHDITITAGALAILGHKIDMTVIAALLTIIGYSINDTVVVYDRIREERALLRGKGYTWLQIMNISVNVTLSRTLLTSVTVLFSVVVLYFLGGDSLKDFALSLIIGVGIGTFSSIFVASALTYEAILLQEWFQTRRSAKRSGGSGSGLDTRRKKPVKSKNDAEANGAQA
ncbi:MAG TPA: protein translocase subunit SecD [Candidatus Hydrogenedentes bacterium]|nr:protein translocase subunit SecD [Candidatus Hydrogenedentota bacterium]